MRNWTIKRTAAGLCAATMWTTGCGGATPQQASTTAAAPAAAAATAPLASGIDRAQFDTAVRVQDDLYRAINGRWLQQTEIPADRSNYGAFTVLADAAERQIRAIVEAAAADTTAADGSERIGIPSGPGAPVYPDTTCSRPVASTRRYAAS